MRAVHQGAPRRRNRGADRGTVADVGARRGRRAPRPAHLTPRRLVGVILAGGASRRYGGTPKGLERIGGDRVVDRVRAALEGVTTDILLSANAPDAEGWMPGMPVVRDRHPGSGGLAGVHAALSSSGDADVLAVAWDMPFVTPELLRLIRARFLKSASEICVPESPSPHGIEPFCACYGAVVRDRMDHFLAHGGGAARDFLDRCTVSRVPLQALQGLGDPATMFLSVNAPVDLERARALHE